MVNPTLAARAMSPVQSRRELAAECANTDDFSIPRSHLQVDDDSQRRPAHREASPCISKITEQSFVCRAICRHCCSQRSHASFSSSGSLATPLLTTCRTARPISSCSRPVDPVVPIPVTFRPRQDFIWVCIRRGRHFALHLLWHLKKTACSSPLPS